MGRFILIGFSALLHAYVGARLAIAFAGAPWALAGFVALLVLSTFMIPLSLIARRSHWGKFTETLAWAGMLFMGLFSSLFVLALLRDVALLLAAALSWVWPALLPTAQWETTSAQWALAAAFVATVIGFVSARRTAAIVHIDIPIAGLAVELHGFTIAQITDIQLTTRVNGEVRQLDRTSRMLFPIARQIAYISTFTSLVPGDIIVTGTPTGAGARFEPPIWLKPGDVIEVMAEGLPTLRNTVQDE